MAVLYLIEPGDLWVTLSVLLLNDRGINLFQFLFTLKRVLMKQNDADSTERGISALYFNTCSKKHIPVYLMKKLVGIKCREKFF